MRKRKAEKRQQNRRDLAATLDALYGRSRESASQSDAGLKTGQDHGEILTKRRGYITGVSCQLDDTHSTIA